MTLYYFICSDPSPYGSVSICIPCTTGLCYGSEPLTGRLSPRQNFCCSKEKFSVAEHRVPASFHTPQPIVSISPISHNIGSYYIYNAQIKYNKEKG